MEDNRARVGTWYALTDEGPLDGAASLMAQTCGQGGGVEEHVREE